MTLYNNMKYLDKLLVIYVPNGDKGSEPFISYVQEMHTQNNGSAIVDATIQLAHSLGKTVVAEGGECEQQLAALRSSGCDYVQDYIFSKPLQITELTSMLRDSPVFTLPTNNTLQGTP